MGGGGVKLEQGDEQGDGQEVVVQAKPLVYKMELSDLHELHYRKL